MAELEKIKSVFEDVGPFMDKIEDFRVRLERRILFGASRFSSFSTQSGEEQTYWIDRRRLSVFWTRFRHLPDAKFAGRLRAPFPSPSACEGWQR